MLFIMLGNFEVLKMLANKHKKMLQEKTPDGQ